MISVEQSGRKILHVHVLFVSSSKHNYGILHLTHIVFMHV